MPRYGLGRRELESVRTAVGAENLLDEKAKGAELVKYLARPEDRLEKLLEQPELLRTPIVRNGKNATAGFCPDVWRRSGRPGNSFASTRSTLRVE